MSTISVSQYGVQSKLLELAATHFGDSDVLKTGLVGYLTEGMSLVHNDGMIHRITMYDEIFKNTAKLPTSINRYASWQKWEIPQASPSYTQVSIAFSYNDLKTKLDTYSQIKISRTDTLELGSFKFTVPYDVVITETDGTISAEYILSSNMTALSDTIQTKYTSNPYIQVATRSIADIDSSSTSTTKYVFFLLDFYQYELTEQVWEHYNATDAIDKAMYYDGAYSDQLIKFDILYNGTLIDKFYNLNETSTGMYAYYTYKEDGKLSVYFDNTATLKPVFGSTLTIQYSTGLGTEGNFTYSGTPYFKFNSTEYNDLNSVVTIVSQPSGGKDKMSLSEIRKYLAYLDLTRDSLTTEYDLENYFETLINELSTSSLQLNFYKKQDDIFRRLFYAFLLFKDSIDFISILSII